jgi:polysaccharide export outer membrane protein
MLSAIWAAATRRAAWWCLALPLPLLLQACAVVTAPGFDFADPKTRTSITLGQYVPGDVDNPPQGVLTPITPTLVKAQFESRSRTVPDEVTRLFAQPKPYTIGPSDIIGVIVYDHPELLPNAGTVISQSTDPTGIASAPGFIVGADGQISFPYIGRIRMEGLTEIEASDLLRERIARYIKDPQVTVRIASFRSRRAYVDGEVRIPGTQIFTDVPMTLPEAINRAGGILPTGDRSLVQLTRASETYRIDLVLLQELGINPSRVLLESGDLITVRSREDNKVFVMGEISRPAALPMRNGRMTLNEAIGESGGPNLATANTRQIYVIRNTAQGTPAVFHLDAGSPVSLALAESFYLRPRDVVYIDPVPLVSWNRIVSLILPSASTVNLGSQVLTR